LPVGCCEHRRVDGELPITRDKRICLACDSEGWWCDPYWSCYVVGNPQYSNQFQFNGGVTFRF